MSSIYDNRHYDAPLFFIFKITFLFFSPYTGCSTGIAAPYSLYSGRTLVFEPQIEATKNLILSFVSFFTVLKNDRSLCSFVRRKKW
jgi:hypothetical protein